MLLRKPSRKRRKTPPSRVRAGPCGDAYGALAGNGLVVVGAGDSVNDLGLVEVLGAFDLRHVADEHAVAHDLGFEAGRTVGVPLGFAAAGQRHPDAELAHAAAEQVSVDATVTKGINHPAGPELIHVRKIAFVPERSLNILGGILDRVGHASPLAGCRGRS